MKAINTRHNGNYYRSRLEARWAVSQTRWKYLQKNVADLQKSIIFA